MRFHDHIFKLGVIMHWILLDHRSRDEWMVSLHDKPISFNIRLKTWRIYNISISQISVSASWLKDRSLPSSDADLWFKLCLLCHANFFLYSLYKKKMQTNRSCYLRFYICHVRFSHSLKIPIFSYRHWHIYTCIIK